VSNGYLDQIQWPQGFMVLFFCISPFRKKIIWRQANQRQPLLFEYLRSLDDLADMLLENFAGRTMMMKQIYEQHNLGTPYLDYNYKHVLTNLEVEGKIQAEPPASKRPKRKGKITFADRVKVTFPPKTE